VKLRHAAALALVGWYLMMPPVGENGKNDTGAPLNRSHHRHTFDSAHDCEKALAAARLSEALGIASLSQREGLSEQDALGLGRFSRDWQCIATDDPRFKGK
jgi:hypothetical protein